MKPLRLEIRNFGAILNMQIDLANTTCAAIAGPNGAGKSTAFTTAPRFALFGTTKDGTGTDDMVRSGSTEAYVAFDFEHQGDTWRVIRTRSIKGRGKSTLELQRLSGDTWASESGASIAETQKKIVDLLGLNDDTFVASSMILQGDAGNFTKRPAGQRKAILAQILQLDQYEALQEKAKAKAAETNIALERIKVQTSAINERLAGRDSLEGEKLLIETKQLTLNNNIKKTETELQDAQVELAGLQAKINQADELGQRIAGLRQDHCAKTDERDRQQRRRDNAQKVIAQEPVIVSAVAEYDALRDEITALKVKKDQQKVIYDEASQIKNELNIVEMSLEKAVLEIGQMENTLANRPQLEQAANEYNKAVAELPEVERLRDEYNQRIQEIQEVQNTFDIAEQQYRFKCDAYDHKIEGLLSKTKMLEDSGCINQEAAQCVFLADAKQANADLIQVRQEYEQYKKDGKDQLDGMRAVRAVAKNRLLELDYDPDKLPRLQKTIADLAIQADQFKKLEAMQPLLENLRTQQTELTGRQVDLETRLQEKREQYKALLDGMDGLPTKEKRLAELQYLVDSKDKLLAAREAETSAASILETLSTELDALTNQITALEQEHTALLGNADTLHQAAQDKVDGLRTTLNTYRTEQTSLTAKLGGIQAQLDALENDAQQYEILIKEMAPLAKKLARLQTLAKAFGRDGIQALILENAVPELERIANDILGQMSGGKNYLRFETQKELKSRSGMAETLDIIVGDWAGERIYETYSGGEQLRIDFAIRFALAEMLARRAGSRVDWLTIDEGFGSQSDEYLPMVIEAVQNVANRFGMVLVISHVKAVQEAFDQKITFCPENDVTEVMVA